jgi:hypothetical protein
MDQNTGDIYHGTLDELAEVEKKKGIQMVPVPEEVASALAVLSPHQRQMWAKANRPSLDQLVEAGADLTAVQLKALQKRERRRLQFLAGKR